MTMPVISNEVRDLSLIIFSKEWEREGLGPKRPHLCPLPEGEEGIRYKPAT
jgi:hypothetical protein